MARVAATAEAVRALEEALRAEPALPAEVAAVLVAGARALVPVALNSGADLVVAAGPGHDWAVHVRPGPAGPALSLRRPRGLRVEEDETSAAPPEGVAARLAHVLRSGTGALP